MPSPIENLRLIEALKQDQALDQELTRDINLLLARTLPDKRGIDAQALLQRLRLLADKAIARRLL